MRELHVAKTFEHKPTKTFSAMLVALLRARARRV